MFWQEIRSTSTSPECRKSLPLCHVTGFPSTFNSERCKFHILALKNIIIIM